MTTEVTAEDGLTKTTTEYLDIDGAAALGLGRFFQCTVATTTRQGCSGCASSGAGALTRHFAYEPLGQVRAEWDDAGRTTRRFFDYQEAIYWDDNANDHSGEARWMLAQRLFGIGASGTPSDDQLTAVDELVDALGMDRTTIISGTG